LRVPRELAEVLIKPLSRINQQFWSVMEVPDDCRLVKVTSVKKNGRKEDPGNCRPGYQGKQWSAITQHIQKTKQNKTKKNNKTTTTTKTNKQTTTTKKTENQA